jgi:hypothetical protein
MKTYFIVFGVFLLLNLPSATANSLQEPVLTIVETNCKKNYLIQLFDNGEINYVGVFGVKKIGKHKAKIKKSVLIHLLNELSNTEAMKNYNKDDQFKGRSVASSGIRLQKNNKTYNFLHLDTTSDLDELEKFKNDAIKKINLEKWIGDYKTGKCMPNGNYGYSFEELN